VSIEPEQVVLPARGAEQATRPPVRIFVGSEPAQLRAERVFVWSIERARDPRREYRITLMRELPGFTRRGWTTGFTNYRFAIPQLCGGRGVALYNDVDQIYLADPGELFDLPQDGCGYRAIARDDTSVMWMDCARMAEIWTLERAQRERKQRLIGRALERDGLHAPLDPRWNVRDDERPVAEAKLVHFTTLHTQPWRPFPERYVYQEHPVGEVWHALERSADAAGFEVHTRKRPSRAYVAWRAAQQLLPPPVGADEEVAGYFPPDPREPTAEALPAEIVLANGALTQIPDTDVAWVLDDLFSRARREVRMRLPWDGTRRSAERWRERVEAKARRHPKLRWQLVLDAGRMQELREGGARASEEPPRVWLLEDDRPGNSTQSLGLADALGWPYERKRLVMRTRSLAHNRLLGASCAGIDRARSSPLAPPWPDLVIAAGRRTGPVALWVREQSGGRTRVVMLGRKGGDQADLFDLAVTPRYCRLYPHPRRLEIAAPLHRVNAARLEEARARWSRFAELPSPRIALLVGGTSGQYRLDADVATRLGNQVMDLADRFRGSVLATTSRRLGVPATRALREALDGASLVHAWRPDDPDNPYLGMLAWADAFVITADSESMLAEAASLGKPIYVAPLPVRASFRALSLLREAVWRRGRAQPAGPRGTPRPQRGLERLCGRLIERGFVRPSRDLAHLHEELVRRGAARWLDAEADAVFEAEPVRDLDAVRARVCELMGVAGR
jgi:mitochondrial fission protein ELM1